MTTQPSASATMTSLGNTGASPQLIGTLKSIAWCRVRLVDGDGRVWNDEISSLAISAASCETRRRSRCRRLPAPAGA
jgi:hypothetical protein